MGGVRIFVGTFPHPLQIQSSYFNTTDRQPLHPHALTDRSAAPLRFRLSFVGCHRPPSLLGHGSVSLPPTDRHPLHPHALTDRSHLAQINPEGTVDQGIISEGMHILPKLLAHLRFHLLTSSECQTYDFFILNEFVCASTSICVCFCRGGFYPPCTEIPSAFHPAGGVTKLSKRSKHTNRLIRIIQNHSHALTLSLCRRARFRFPVRRRNCYPALASQTRFTSPRQLPFPFPLLLFSFGLSSTCLSNFNIIGSGSQ